MADPHRILAVCTISFEVARVIHGLIVRLREVPNELLAFSNDIYNLKFVHDSVLVLHSPHSNHANRMHTEVANMVGLSHRHG
ncbi:hypothetical protein BDR22DRAFT_718474 [Usnea florida]